MQVCKILHEMYIVLDGNKIATRNFFLHPYYVVTHTHTHRYDALPGICIDVLKTVRDISDCLRLHHINVATYPQFNEHLIFSTLNPLYTIYIAYDVYTIALIHILSLL